LSVVIARPALSSLYQDMKHFFLLDTCREPIDIVQNHSEATVSTAYGKHDAVLSDGAAGKLFITAPTRVHSGVARQVIASRSRRGRSAFREHQPATKRESQACALLAEREAGSNGTDSRILETSDAEIWLVWACGRILPRMTL
jgi:hypothetical protein